MNNKMSNVLYLALCNKTNGREGLNEAPHCDQFKVGGHNYQCYKSLYLDQIEYFNGDGKLKPPPNDWVCSSCKNHFLSRRPKIDHGGDIQAGAILEKIFCDFMNEKFREFKLSVYCCRADQSLKNMPDFVVKSPGSGEGIDVLYFEFKCIFKPFILINKKLPGKWCYSNSLTLDSDDKLVKQFGLLEDKGIKAKTVYVYWYDIPCIKGVFWSWAKDVEKIWKDSRGYTRELSSGDFRNGLKVGHTDKVYLTLPGMNDFYSLFSVVDNIVNEVNVAN